MAEAVKLFQYNTLSALMSGLYEGTMTIEELLAYGDTGLGTLDSIDGELTIIEGRAYQAVGTESGLRVVELDGTATVPYAAVVNHQAEVMFKQRFEMTRHELYERMISYYDGENLFRSIKIQGQFTEMKVRAIPKSAYGKRFAEVATHQPQFQATAINGTIVGFWTPELFHGVSAAGFHLHFISDDRTFGGHIMDFTIQEGIIEIGPVDELDQRFPVKDRQYLFAKLNVEALSKDIKKSE